ncbi:MAG: NUDIX domain-containing protein [Myxococcota bacterium]
MLEQTIGVAVFVLRPGAGHDTEVLLLERAGGDMAGSWSPVAGRIRPDEREADAALRELAEETSLAPERLYAATFSGYNERADRGDVGRIGLFVAFVPAESAVTLDAESSDHAWHPIRSAIPLLPQEAQQAVLSRVLDDFVRTPPDESLRIL